MPKKLFAIIIILIFLVQIPNNYGSAQSYEDADIRIVCDPDSVVLAPGEGKTIEIRITNLNTEIQYIQLEYIFPETFGLTKGKLSEDYFPLLPNETHIAELHLSTSSGWFHSESDNDGLLEVTWAADDFRENHTQGLSNLRHFTRIKIDVTKDMAVPIIIFMIIIIIAIVIIIFVIKKHRKKTT